MRKIREALRLKHALGLSERQIAVSVGVSRSTVAEYLRRAGVVGITWPVQEEMDDAELEQRLFTPPSFEPTPARAQPDWNHVHKGTAAAIQSLAGITRDSRLALYRVARGTTPVHDPPSRADLVGCSLVMRSMPLGFV